MPIPVHVKIKKKDWNMDILVIGNGFDLAHGLKTSYKDFLTSCRSKENQSLNEEFCKTNLWLRHFIKRQNDIGNTWIDLEKEIYRVITKIYRFRNWNGNNKNSGHLLKINRSMNEFNLDEIYSHINQDYFNKDCKNKGYTLDIYKNDKYYFYVYFESFRGFINFLYDQLREFTNIFSIYLNKDVLSLLPVNSPYNLSLSNNNHLYILSFNYTDTCERLYGKMFSFKSYYVHGNIECKNGCNLVLGTYSFDNKTQNENPRSAIPYEFNVFRKHNQRHKYGTIEAYQELLKELTDHRKVIKPVFHVIGHSLDETDKNILKHLFLINPNAIINIYYHDEEAQERLINNITGIIGEEEVMMRVRLIYQHDENRGILKHRD